MAQFGRPTPLFGREREIARLHELLVYERDVRLVTLVGPGGVGKTRLAEQLLEAVREEFGGDVCFVDLSPVRESGRVPSVIAGALGIPIPDDRDAEEVLVDRLRDRELLLVLDNFEQVMDADLVVWTLVASCRDLVVLVTSREPLRVDGQHLVDVPPLDTPRDPEALRLDESPRYPALQLFAARARSARPDFALDEENVAAVADVCTRLAGLPLAIELAAARMGTITLRDLSTGLDHMLDLLSHGPRNAPARHRSLRAAIAWSYDLLSPQEQRLFRRVSVFAGGCTVASARAMLRELPEARRDHPAGCGGDARLPALPDVVDLLSSLVDKGLLTTSGADPARTRFVPLEPIRLFAAEQLRAHGEETDVLRAHTASFLALAEEAFPHLRGEEPAPWLAALDVELDNFRAALGWATAPGGTDGDIGLRLANALFLFWRLRGHYREAKRWLNRALAAADAVSSPRADALLLLGHATNDDDRRSADCYEQSRVMYRALGDARGEAGALSCLGMSTEHMGDYPRALAYHEESLRLFYAHGDEGDIAVAEHQLGRVATSVEDYALAKAHFEEARGRFLRLGRSSELAYTLLELGRIAGLEERWDEADDILTWSLTAFRANDLSDGIGRVLCELGSLALRRGDATSAASSYRQTLALFAEHRWENEWVIVSIEGLAQIAVERDDVALGVQLLGTAAAWRETAGRKPKPVEQAALDRATTRARRALSERTYAEAWQRGFLLSRVGDAVEHAMTFAVRPAAGAPASRQVGRPSNVRLTPQQRVVLCCLAEGLTNQQTADRLSISVRTVTTHVTAVLTALGTDNRAGAAAFAVRHDLCPL